MSSTFRLGRVAGVEIGAHWSWLLVAALITWSLAEGVFPTTNPGLSDATYLVMALVAVPVFFAALLLHELGHAVTAKREGMEIDGITLWVFGGVAKFRGHFPSAGAEFRIAVAGPAVTLVLGVLFLTVSLLLPLPAAVDGTLHWLGYINLVLLAFNLLPAFPLDGGRVLRAALWQRTGDERQATRTAAGFGRGFGQMLIVGGLLLAITGAVISGLWFVFIGWFLVAAAEAEAAEVTARAALAGLRVADAMVPAPVTVDAGVTLQHFVDDVFLHHRHTAYPVVEDGRPVGLITFRDAAAADRAGWSTATVGERRHRLRDVLVLEPEQPLEAAWPDLLGDPLRRALVTGPDGRLAGLLSSTDVMRILELGERPGTPSPHATGPAAGPGATGYPPAHQHP
jgi:Zn-dependent protease/CBS domain-containing protein